MTDHYHILGLAPTASKTEVKKAYRKLSLKYHPDQNDGSEKYTKKFIEIQEAYEVLYDEKKRKQYDQYYRQMLQNRANEPIVEEEVIKPVVEYFRADKIYIQEGESVLLEWKTSDADEIVILPFGAVEATGLKSFKVNKVDKESITLTIQAINISTGRMDSKFILLRNQEFEANDTPNKKDTATSTSPFLVPTISSLFSPEGRLPRSDYILRLFLSLLLFIVVLYHTFEKIQETNSTLLTFILVTVGLFSTTLIVFQTIKRLHDLDLSAWFLLLFFIPYLNFLFLFFILLAKGTNGVNVFGDDPRT